MSELTLTIGLARYAVELPDGPDAGYVVLHHGDGHSWCCEARRDGYDPRRTTPEGLSCDCPDFTFRHAGTGSPGCKHLTALRSHALLVPVPGAEPAEGFALELGDAITRAERDWESRR